MQTIETVYVTCVTGQGVLQDPSETAVQRFKEVLKPALERLNQANVPLALLSEAPSASSRAKYGFVVIDKSTDQARLFFQGTTLSAFKKAGEIAERVYGVFIWRKPSDSMKGVGKWSDRTIKVTENIIPDCAKAALFFYMPDPGSPAPLKVPYDFYAWVKSEPQPEAISKLLEIFTQASPDSMTSSDANRRQAALEHLKQKKKELEDEELQWIDAYIKASRGRDAVRKRMIALDKRIQETIQEMTEEQKEP